MLVPISPNIVKTRMNALLVSEYHDTFTASFSCPDGDNRRGEGRDQLLTSIKGVSSNGRAEEGAEKRRRSRGGATRGILVSAEGGDASAPCDVPPERSKRARDRTTAPRTPEGMRRRVRRRMWFVMVLLARWVSDGRIA